MSFENLLTKTKQHWIAVLLLTLLLATVLFGVALLVEDVGTRSSAPSLAEYGRVQKAYDNYGGYAGAPGDGSFAPNDPDRKIEHSASIASEVGRGEFDAAQGRLEVIVGQHKGLLLNKNVYQYGRSDSRTGSYSLKIPVAEYNQTITQLKAIGELESFNENADDVTGQYADAQIELATERARLERYRALYQSYGTLGDKLSLEDKVFEQERRIEYLQSSLMNQDQRIEYASVSVTLREEESTWAELGFLKMSDLAKTFVASLKALLYTIAAVLPWAIIALLAWLGVRAMRRKA